MREQLLHRPLIGVLIGLCLGLSLTFGWWPVVAGLLLAGVVRDLRFGILVLLAFGVGWFLRPPPPAGFFESIEFGGVAQVVSVPDHYGAKTSAMIELRGEKYRLMVEEGGSFARGDTLRVKGILGPLSEASGYGGGARGVLRATRVETLREGARWWHWASAVATSFRNSVDSGLSEHSAALVRGVCFNQTDGLLIEDWEAFRRFGIVHLLSASGFHVVVVAGMLLGLISLFPIPRLWQIGIVLAVLGLFAMAAGFRPPIVRAVLMTAALLPAYALRREADGLSAVAFAGVLNLVLNPAVIVDLGFHLSMVTTLGLVMVVTERRWRDWTWVRRVTYPSLVATLASFPLVGFVFGEVSLIGILGNLVVAPLVGLLVVLSLLSWGIGILVPPLGEGLWRIVDLYAEVIRVLVFLGSEVPGGRVGVPAFSVIGLVCLYGLLVLAWGRYAVD